MNTTKLTREEALLRWNASKETKRKMVEKLEILVRNSCKKRDYQRFPSEFTFVYSMLFSWMMTSCSWQRMTNSEGHCRIWD